MAVEDTSTLQAALKNTLVLDKGTGNPTFTRATSATVFDNEGNLITAPSGAARFSAARFSYNVTSHFDEWGNNANYTIVTANGPDGNATGIDLTYTLSTGSFETIYDAGNDTSIKAGEQMVWTFALKTGTHDWTRISIVAQSGVSLTWMGYINASTGAVGVTWNSNSTTGATTNNFTTSSLGNGWYQAKLAFTALSDMTIRFYVYMVDGDNVDTANTFQNDNVFFADSMVTISAPISPLYFPPYISRGFLTAPFQGSGIDGAQWYTTDRALSALSDSSLKGYLGEPAATNLALHCRNATNAAWTKTNITAVKDQTGIDNTVNSASKLTSTAANGTCLQTITLAAATRSFSVYVKRITGTGTVEITRNGGTNWTDITSSINSSTYTRVAIKGTSILNPQIGFRIVTSGDVIAFDYAQDEVGSKITNPILTTTTSATRNADVLTYQTTSNFSDTAGAIAASVTSDDWANIAGNIGSSTTGLATSSANNGVQAKDGTNTVSGPTGTPVNLMQLAIGWSGSTLKAASEEVIGTSGSYDGSFGLSNISVGIEGNTRDLNIWTSALTDAQLEEAAGAPTPQLNLFSLQLSGNFNVTFQGEG